MIVVLDRSGKVWAREPTHGTAMAKAYTVSKGLLGAEKRRVRSGFQALAEADCCRGMVYETGVCAGGLAHAEGCDRVGSPASLAQNVSV